MRTGGLVGAIVLGLGLAAPRAPAQVVEAGVVIRSGPVAGHVVIGPPPPVVVYREPARVVVVERYAPRVIVVREVHVPRGRAYGWWKKHGYRRVVVYYDGHAYYDRWVDGRPGIREVVVYERDGRYYHGDWDDHDGWRDRDRWRDRDDWD